jgi:hypothetical protein
VSDSDVVAAIPKVDLLKPYVRETPGGWMATEQHRRFPRIGVMGTSRAEAIANFAFERERWLLIQAGWDESDV